MFNYIYLHPVSHQLHQAIQLDRAFNTRVYTKSCLSTYHSSSAIARVFEGIYHSHTLTLVHASLSLNQDAMINLTLEIIETMTQPSTSWGSSNMSTTNPWLKTTPWKCKMVSMLHLTIELLHITRPAPHGKISNHALPVIVAVHHHTSLGVGCWGNRCIAQMVARVYWPIWRLL